MSRIWFEAGGVEREGRERETHECRRSSTRFFAICTSSAERSSMLKVNPGAKTEPKSESSIARNRQSPAAREGCGREQWV